MSILTHTEENYLKAIYHISPEGESVSTNALAFSMQTTAASANDMLKRLSQKGLLDHTKYKGALISNEGRILALQVIRKHRLWETFLVEKLKFGWDEVHVVAEQLEHIQSPLLTERLDELLNFPKFDPHGDPIPDKDGNFNIGSRKPLAELQIGDKGVLTCVTNDDPKLLKYLDSIQVRLGTKVIVKGVIDFDHSYEISTDQKASLFISNQVAQLLLITQEL